MSRARLGQLEDTCRRDDNSTFQPDRYDFRPVPVPGPDPEEISAAVQGRPGESDERGEHLELLFSAGIGLLKVGVAGEPFANYGDCFPARTTYGRTGRRSTSDVRCFPYVADGRARVTRYAHLPSDPSHPRYLSIKARGPSRAVLFG